MSQTSYESIEPLIASSDEVGASMHVVFRCPVSGHSVDARGYMQASNTMGSRAAASAKRNVLYSLRNALSRSIRNALGYGIAGQVASDVARGTMTGAGSKQSYSDADRRAAVVRAFESVSSQFVWDAQTNRYIGRQAAGDVLTDFMRQLESAPVTAPYDQGVLARMLTEIACADGTVAQEERDFLVSFIPPNIGTVDSVAQMPRLSAAELGETTRGPMRDTLYMLAWAVALTDESLSPQEEARIGEFAGGLGIAKERAQALRHFAQVYLVDHALGQVYPSGRRNHTAYAEVMAMARHIGLSEDEAERVDIRFRKRYGLA